MLGTDYGHIMLSYLYENLGYVGANEFESNITNNLNWRNAGTYTTFSQEEFFPTVDWTNPTEEFADK